MGCVGLLFDLLACCLMHSLLTCVVSLPPAHLNTNSRQHHVHVGRQLRRRLCLQHGCGHCLVQLQGC
jgi:hypothetical protein